ncbi:hypothetical protein MTO96_003288 [Rhipicephalus appendiculatus]
MKTTASSAIRDIREYTANCRLRRPRRLSRLRGFQMRSREKQQFRSTVAETAKRFEGDRTKLHARSLSKMMNGNGCGEAVTSSLTWSVGLLNGAHKYLTAETFGFKVNANGAALKKKQLWSLEPCCDAGEEAVRLRSHLNRYLAVDQFGNVTCDAEEPGAGAIFQITVSADAKGQWALRNTNRGYFLGASADQLVCVAKAPGPSELWTVHLAARPQVTIRSIRTPSLCPPLGDRGRDSSGCCNPMGRGHPVHT